MGAGKTAVGRELARRWRVKLRDTDSEVTRVAGRSIAAVFADQGEAAFRELEAAAVAQALIEHDGVLALGGGAVLHADTRAALDRYVARGGRVVLLDVSAGAVAARLSRDGARPLLGDDPMARWQELADQRRAIYQAVATHVVTTDDRTPAQVAREVQRVLEAR
jgi:shikimate kinase